MGIEVRLPKHIVDGVMHAVPEIIVAWGGDEPCAFDACGFHIVVPAFDQVADPKAPGTIYRYGPAKLNGHAIPGTISLKTEVAVTAEGARSVPFDAEEILRFLMNPVKPESIGKLVDRGLIALRKPEDVAGVMPVLRDAYEKSTEESDRALLAGERARLQKFKEQGLEPTPSQIDGRIRLAMKRMEARRARGGASAISIDELDGAMTGKVPEKKVEQVPSSTSGASFGPVIEHLLAEARKFNVSIGADLLVALTSPTLETVQKLSALVEQRSQPQPVQKRG